MKWTLVVAFAFLWELGLSAPWLTVPLETVKGDLHVIAKLYFGTQKQQYLHVIIDSGSPFLEIWGDKQVYNTSSFLCLCDFDSNPDITR